ncbi:MULTISPECIES: hypothetical protein [unclassified Streptomyces]|nr:hypothetical protein [Streptomyces sp. CB02414]
MNWVPQVQRTSACIVGSPPTYPTTRFRSAPTPFPEHMTYVVLPRDV